MFGFVSKKKLKNALEFLVENNDTSKASGDTADAREKDFYYRAGNANAVNYISHKLGITIRERSRQ